MFNGILKSDDVEVYENNTNLDHHVPLMDNCKSNIIIIGSSSFTTVSLPINAYVGKVISITSIYGTNGTGKTTSTNTVLIKHSATTLFTLKQGTVSFMYVGQQLNGLTATDKAKSGWIILGGVQGDTAITGYLGSVAIGSGAYCSADSGVALGKGANAGSGGIGLGLNAYGSTGIAIGNGATTNSSAGIAFGQSSEASYNNSVSIGAYAKSLVNKIALKSNTFFNIINPADAQAGKFILMRQTTDATPLVISATNAAASTTNILILPNNGTYAFKGIVVAKDASTLDSAMWEVTALMKRGANASTTAIVGTPTITKVFADTGASAWSIALTADTTNGGGAITVTGEAGKTIRWVSNIDSAEVI